MTLLPGSFPCRILVSHIEVNILHPLLRCTLPTHGSRLIPPGTITAAQFIRAPSYVEFTGRFDQTKLNIREGDAGGELDSGGQDARGNPIGGIAYSTNLPSMTGTLSQSRMWHLFLGACT